MSYNRAITLVFALIAFLLSMDIYFDIQEGASLRHVTVEIIAFIAAMVPCVATLVSLAKNFQSRELVLERNIQVLDAERASWQKQAQGYLQALGIAIDAQFERWGFSAAEKEIGLLILKGLSHKEIAELRGTAERTVRQQAGAIYAKAHLEGKAQLSAFFLEDLQLLRENQGASAS